MINNIIIVLTEKAVKYMKIIQLNFKQLFANCGTKKKQLNEPITFATIVHCHSYF